MGRIKMKQVEGLGNVTVETAIEEFLRNWSGCKAYALPEANRTRRWHFISAPSRNSRK